jgi:hypothetical protein
VIQRTRYIFIFIFICSVCSLTLQATIINICKESKVFKNQNQQNPITEEEEESHDGDETMDEELMYISHEQFSFSTQISDKFILSNSISSIPSCYFKIPIPPPKY